MQNHQKVFYGFTVHSFSEALEISINHKNPLINPSFRYIVDSISKFASDDSFYIHKMGNSTRLAIEKIQDKYSVSVEDYYLFYKNCTLDETITILKNLESVLENPAQYGFVEDGTEGDS